MKKTLATMILILSLNMGGVSAQSYYEVPPYKDEVGYSEEYGHRNCAGFAICAAFDQRYSSSSDLSQQYSSGGTSVYLPESYFTILESDVDDDDETRKRFLLQNVKANDILNFGTHVVYVDGVNSRTSPSGIEVSEVENYDGNFNENVTLQDVIDRIKGEDPNFENSWMYASIYRLKDV